jgi:hypothetical protein
LIETDIPVIRNLATKLFHKEIGQLFGVGREAIDKITRNERWTHVKGVATDKEVKAYLKKLKK